jgi:uncharacterized protein YxjI
MIPRLIVEQRITAFVNQYSVFAANPDGSKGALRAFAQQKRLAFKERVTFYTDDTKTTTVFTFRAEKALDVHGRYFVENPDGKLIGSFRKDFTKSLINSTWHILDERNKPNLVVQESSQTLAVLRRFIGIVPLVGEGVDIILSFFRYHFVFVDDAGNIVGRYQKTTLLRDHYMLSMTDDAYAKEDVRVLAALAVALDALQSR